MSFILDALRKSEKERQKAQVPGIGDAPLVVHRSHVPRWMVGVIAGLSGCLVMLVWLWLQSGDPGTDPESAGMTELPAVSSPGAAAPATPQNTEIRDLAVEARQATTFDAPGAEGPTASSSVAPPMEPVEPAVSAAPTRTLAQFRASGGPLPDLNLELHVYSASAAERFVFINSTKYLEGETLAEGPRLGAITEEGAVLVFQGQSLLLPRE